VSVVLADVLAVLVALAVLTVLIALIVSIALIAAVIAVEAIVVADIIAEADIAVVAGAVAAVDRFRIVTKTPVAYGEEKGPYNGCRGSSLQE
jgi:hypothetical protein